MLTKLLFTFLCFHFQVRVDSQEKSSPTSTPSGQCAGTNELEGLRYHLYSELSESRKEIDTLRTDLSILKKYILDKRDAVQTTCNTSTGALDEKLDYLIVQSNNITNDKINELREELINLTTTQSQQLHKILSDCEVINGHLPLGTFLNPAPSCKALPEGSSTGNYWIQKSGTNNASLRYCVMTKGYCNSAGGWMRVAYLDMTDPSHHCPRGFRRIDSPKRTCGRPSVGCYSTTYPLDGISYSRVCGRIKAYQDSHTDAFWAYYKNRALTIDSNYVDGVSLTHGRSPRKHIWTFASALDENVVTANCCPCTKTVTPFTGIVPPFIGNDYFCDTGNRFYQDQFNSEDPLWDGAGCGGTSTCCQFNNPPWFRKQLPQPTTDNIELRLCSDEYSSAAGEEIAIEQVELYVQ